MGSMAEGQMVGNAGLVRTVKPLVVQHGTHAAPHAAYRALC